MFFSCFCARVIEATLSDIPRNWATLSDTGRYSPTLSDTERQKRGQKKFDRSWRAGCSDEQERREHDFALSGLALYLPGSGNRVAQKPSGANVRPNRNFRLVFRWGVH